MPIRLDSKSPDFPARFAQFLATKREASADVDKAVREIVADVAARGDDALIELSRKFDRVDLAKLGLAGQRAGNRRRGKGLRAARRWTR